MIIQVFIRDTENEPPDPPPATKEVRNTAEFVDLAMLNETGWE